MNETRVVSASQVVAAAPERIFALIADPAEQPRWDGNENLSSSSSPRVSDVGDVFSTTLTSGSVRENHVVEFVEGQVIAWRPAPVGEEPPGHLWRWELAPDSAGTLVTHTYDWTLLRDESRLAKARATTSAMLAASLSRLAALAEESSR